MTISSETNIVPTVGDYTFADTSLPNWGFFHIVDFSGNKYVRFSIDNRRYDTFEVTNGRFYREWGLGGEGGWPTDAYAISGHFTTPTHAEGQIKHGFDKQITREGTFTADLKP